MLTVCYSPKGGQGCTTVAVALAHLIPDALLIDSAGDAPAAAGIPAPEGPGICDLLHSDHTVTAETIARLATTSPSMSIIPAGHTPAHEIAADRWTSLADALPADWPVILDAATNPAVAAIPAARRIMVVQPCYLALRRAVAMPMRPDQIVLVADRSRALSERDIETALGVAVTAIVPIDPLVARAVDAGLLTARPPSVLGRRLGPLTDKEARRNG